MSLDLRLQAIWYDASPSCWRWLLAPLSLLFALIVLLRRTAYRIGLLQSVRIARPVLVVGNITVGGTGKTPLVIWLASALAARGLRVAVITRGYGGKASHWPQPVSPDSDPEQVGDESVLIARQTPAQVVAGPDRVASAQWAVAQGAELVISDDGLQHYRLHRDGELVVVDASRRFGNGWLLPAGPLREPVSRLRQADLVLWNRRAEAVVDDAALSFQLQLTGLKSLMSSERMPLEALRGQRVHVVTAIGHPQGFIAALQQYGMRVDARILPDHALLRRADIEFDDELPVLMTGKDAVKCRAFASSRHWEATAEVVLTPTDRERLLDGVERIRQRAERP